MANLVDILESLFVDFFDRECHNKFYPLFLRRLIQMMYIHYCATCHHIHMLNGHKTQCPICEKTLKEMDMTYMDYVHLLPKEREKLLMELKSSCSF